MTQLERALDQLGSAAAWGYRPGGTPATEPTSLAVLALAAHGRDEAARRTCDGLARVQSAAGSLGVTRDESVPAWPTGLAVLAWVSASGGEEEGYRRNIEAAIRWILGVRGETQPVNEVVGHDTTLIGWPWVEGTHAWVEPTAFNVLALKAAGRGDHPRCREAVRLLVDRFIPTGGCNYGNKSVFGTDLRPQLAPTGLALMALGGEADATGMIRRSLDYVSSGLEHRTPTAGLCYGLLAMAAHGRESSPGESFRAEALDRALGRETPAAPLALLCLAAPRGCDRMHRLGSGEIWRSSGGATR